MRPKDSETTQKSNTGSVRNFKEGERVSCRNYNRGDKWIFGRVLKRIGKLHYLIKLDDGRTWKRHINQIRLIGEYTPSRLPSEDNNVGRYIDYAIDTVPQQAVNPPSIDRAEEPPNAIQPIRRSERTRVPPVRYGDFRAH
ncbi:hypothetical protein KPH14_001060 [Odynerus spinipes]|uniref:Uncharacterized protein n=1 Tax=Odynerus spinipes TaxID=1348599 RepID=A0AAD9REZ4_9HYME|nr:hypothetical protein KPH14_001060 [Odynerus spinipes]